MATSNSVGFTHRNQAVFTTNVAATASRKMSGWRQAIARFAAPSNDQFSGPTMQQLTPDLLNETGRR